MKEEMIEIECPICNTEFDAHEWRDGKCPGCGNTYGWDEMYDEDTFLSYSFVDWDFYSEEERQEGKDRNYRLKRLRQNR